VSSEDAERSPEHPGLRSMPARLGLARLGVLDWIAIALLAIVARGNFLGLFLLCCLFASVTTMTLNPDTTAVLLTPAMLPLAMCAVWLANAASLLLPVSNLTNLLAQNRVGLSTATFAAQLGPAQTASLAVTLAFLWACYLYFPAIILVPAMLRRDKPGYRVLLTVDIAESAGRPSEARIAVRKGLRSMLKESLACYGIPWYRCRIKDLGDGFRVIPPLGTSKADLVMAVNGLSQRLRAHNHVEGFKSNKRTRVRAALHDGHIDFPGHRPDGRALEVLSRLIVAPKLHEALKAAAADTPLVLIMSGHYYEDYEVTAQPGSLFILPQDFEKVDVEVKEYKEEAWLFVPAFSVHSVRSAPPQS
jgi:hypothetical protein